MKNLIFQLIAIVLLMCIHLDIFSQSYRFIGTWDANGVPNYLEPIPDTITTEALNDIYTVLPERHKNLTYVDYNNYLNIKLDTATRVWVSIIAEGAGFKNTLSYYTYAIGNSPSSTSDIDSLTVLFPNASMSGSGGGLSAGDKVYLDSFLTNTEIAFCLSSNAYDDVNDTVGNGYAKYFTNFNLNPENTDSLRAHNVVFWDNSCKKYVLGFEDLDRRYGSDDDFNDCLFYITMDPLPPFARPGGDSNDIPPVLPVELISFEASYSNSSIILNWTTASEISNQGFEIQRAIDSFEFKKIGYVSGNGNSNTINNYTYTDNASSNSGIYYYRLKQIDFDGKYEYSGIQTVRLTNSKLLFSAFPNPLIDNNKLLYKISSNASYNEGIISLFTTSGILIYSMPIHFNGSVYSGQINISGIKSGMYILEYRTRVKALREKVIVP